MTRTGRVESIFVAPETTGTPERRTSVDALAGRGLRGDRYFDREGGTFEGSDLTLIETEAVAGAEREYGVDLDPGAHRRNVVTRGVPLNHLVGETFRVGTALARGDRLCEPCSHLESLAGDGVAESLVHRGGLRATILEDGTVSAGDEIRWDD